MNAPKLLAALLLGLAAFSATGRDFVDMDPSEVVAKYGKPDRVHSAENERPRPMIITRQMEYRNAGVRVALLSNDTSPPFRHWKLLGYQDIKTNAVLSQEVFESRLAAARNNKRK